MALGAYASVYFEGGSAAMRLTNNRGEKRCTERELLKLLFERKRLKLVDLFIKTKLRIT